MTAQIEVPRERVQQLTAEQIGDVPQLPDETVEAVTLVPRGRVQRRVAECIGGVPQFREENVDEEAPETASQDRGCSEQWSGPSWTMSRLPKLPFRSDFLKGLCEQSGVLEVSSNSGQENVERVKKIRQEEKSGRTGERIGAIEGPKISGQVNVVATNVPQERSSERKG